MEGKRLIDKEKVIRWLEACSTGCEPGCPYEYENMVHMVECKADLMLDALELLKAQEPIDPKVTKRKAGFGNVLSCWFNCGNCNKPIEHLKYRFCPYCGKGIKWDESEKDD